MKKVMTAVLAMLMTFIFIGTGLAMEQGNNRKGKYTYRKVYKACQERGEVDSPKPVLDPDSKTQAGWTETFDNKQFQDFKCQEEWSKLSEEDLSDIYAYLWSFAAGLADPGQMQIDPIRKQRMGARC